MGEKKNEPKPLPPFDGAVPVPCWTIRPGAVSAIPEKVRKVLPVWCLIRSFNHKKTTRRGPELSDCRASLETLSSSLGVGVRSINGYLRTLRGFGGLLLEVPRPDRRTGRRRPPLRWATDPVRWWAERKIIEDHLEEIAERDGLGNRWLDDAHRDLDRHDRKASKLAKAIQADFYP